MEIMLIKVFKLEVLILFMEQKLIVKESSINGLGVFTSKDIQEGETICFMNGSEMSVEDVIRMYDSGEEREGDPFQIDSRIYINLAEPYVYINHSCEPNGGIRGKNELIALRDIEKGEEITYDYSTTEWSNDIDWGDEYVDWTMDCECKSFKCRKLIGDFNKLDDTVKENYRGLNAIPDHILKKENTIVKTE